jgi:hypothetical protein
VPRMRHNGASMPDPLPPPTEFAWDTPVKDILTSVFQFSPDLLDAGAAPRLIMMYADHLQVNWQLSGLPDPINQCVVDLRFSARPVAPATIVINPANNPTAVLG